MRITGILQAAGMSSRMGRNKLLLPYKNHTVIEESLDQLANSVADEILVVTGHENSRIREVIAKHLTDRITILENENYQLGRAESIKCAIQHLDRRSDAALFMVADKPGVSTQLIDRAIAEFKKATPAILYVQTPAGRGHPIIFSRDLFDDLLLLQGDRIGNELVAKHAAHAVELADQATQVDIDTDEDYERLIKKLNQSE